MGHETRTTGWRVVVRNRKAVSLPEVLVVVAVLGVLAVLLAPALNSTQVASGQATATSNLRQLVAAGLSHAQENRGYLPNTHWVGERLPYSGVEGESTTYWFSSINPYLYGSGENAGNVDGVFRAPFFRGHQNHGNTSLPAAWDRIDFINVYAWWDSEANAWNYMNVLQSGRPAKMPFLMTGYNDGTAGLTDVGSFNRWVYHPQSGGGAPGVDKLPKGKAFVYRDSILVGFADGRVEAVPFEGSSETYERIFGRR